MWKHPINQTDLWDLTTDSWLTVNNQILQDIQLVNIQPKTLAWIGMFVEYGQTTGHPYQPLANHRQLSPLNFYQSVQNDSDKWVPPMYDSLFYPVPSTDFNLGNSIMVFPYEIIEVDEEDTSKGHSIYSCSKMKFVQEPQCGKVLHGRGKLLRRRAIPLSREALVRTFKLFGCCSSSLKEEKKYGNSTMVECVGQLFKHLSRTAFYEERFIRHFIDTHELDGFYQYKDGLSPEENYRHLGLMIRSLSPLRFAIVDGQHRFHVCQSAIRGHIDFSSEVSQAGVQHVSIHQDPSVVEKLPKLKDDSKFVYRKTQLAKPLSVKIGSPKIGKFASQLAQLRGFGAAVTAGDDTRVEITYRGLILGFLEELTLNGYVVQELDPKSFWNLPLEKSKEKMVETTESWFEPFIEFVKSKSCDKFLLGAVQDKSWEKDVVPKIRLQLHDFAYFLNGTSQTANKIPVHIGVAMTLLKFLFYKQSNMIKFERYLETVYLQSMSWMQYVYGKGVHTRFTNIGWIRLNILYPVYHVQSVLIAKMIVEKKIMYELNRNKPLPDTDVSLLEKQIDNTASNFTCFSSLIDMTRPFPNDKQVNMKNSSKMTQKLQYVTVSELFEDILDTFEEFGPSPKIIPFESKTDDMYDNIHFHIYME